MNFTVATMFLIRDSAGPAFGECLTSVAPKPSIEIEQATTSYSFQVP
jgi:hypothetical protein